MKRAAQYKPRGRGGPGARRLLQPWVFLTTRYLYRRLEECSWRREGKTLLASLIVVGLGWIKILVEEASSAQIIIF